jgi:hypothetical protein
MTKLLFGLSQVSNFLPAAFEFLLRQRALAVLKFGSISRFCCPIGHVALGMVWNGLFRGNFVLKPS